MQDIGEGLRAEKRMRNSIRRKNEREDKRNILRYRKKRGKRILFEHQPQILIPITKVDE